MNTGLNISQQVYDKLPNLVVISGTVNVGTPNESKIRSYLNESWKKLKGEADKIGYKELPNISLWRNAFINAGIKVKDFPLSIEAIAKRTQKSDQPFSINPIVDTYNAISMDLILPLGAYDLSELEGNLQLRVTTASEDFYAIGSTENDPTLVNEIVYSDDKTILTRQFLWRQANKGKITNQTESFIFVNELLTDMDEDQIANAQKIIEDKFKELLNAEIVNLSVQRK